MWGWDLKLELDLKWELDLTWEMDLRWEMDLKWELDLEWERDLKLGCHKIFEDVTQVDLCLYSLIKSVTL